MVKSSRHGRQFDNNKVGDVVGKKCIRCMYARIRYNMSRQVEYCVVHVNKNYTYDRRAYTTYNNIILSTTSSCGRYLLYVFFVLPDEEEIIGFDWLTV